MWSLINESWPNLLESDHLYSAIDSDTSHRSKKYIIALARRGEGARGGGCEGVRGGGM